MTTRNGLTERERERKNKRMMDFRWQVRQLEGNVNCDTMRYDESSREVGKFLLNARAFVKKESVLIALKTCT